MSSKWAKVASGRFSSGTTGQERKYILPVQNWGLQVKDLLTAVVVYGRKSENAQIKLSLSISATPDENTLFPGTTSPISAAQTVSGDLPKTFPGTGVTTTLPYFQLVLSVLNSQGGSSSEEYVDVEIYAGGKQY